MIIVADISTLSSVLISFISSFVLLFLCFDLVHFTVFCICLAVFFVAICSNVLIRLHRMMCKLIVDQEDPMVWLSSFRTAAAACALLAGRAVVSTNILPFVLFNPVEEY